MRLSLSLKQLALLCLTYVPLTGVFGQTTGINQTNPSATACGCNYVIYSDVRNIWAGSSNMKALDGTTKTFNPQPGEVICLQAATWDYLSIKNIQGSSTGVITIKNCGGLVDIYQPTLSSTAIAFSNCKYFKISGAGDVNYPYGIRVTGQPFATQNCVDYYTPNVGMSVDGLSTECEVEAVEISKTDFGMMVKTDPDCNNSATWRENFTMTNVKIHDNYIHETGTGEGFYIGNSFHQDGVYTYKDAQGVTQPCLDQNGNQIRHYPHNITGLRVYNNRTYDTGSEGIQVGCASADCEIYNNKVELHGQRPLNCDSAQAKGIQIGGGTVGKCYNNFIRAGSTTHGSSGIFLNGLGDNYVYNNVIIGSGEYGVYIDEPKVENTTIPNSVYYVPVSTGPGTGYRIINNTIINPTKSCLHTRAEQVEKNYFYNNILIHTDTSDCISTMATGGINPVVVGTSPNTNYKNTAATTTDFVNPGSYNYHLTPGSAAKNPSYTIDASSYGVTTDFDGQSRTTPYDAGAFEFATQTMPVGCTAYATYTYGYDITNVTIGQLNHSTSSPTSPPQTPAYNDYTGLCTSACTNLALGSGYTISIGFNHINSNGAYLAVYIDLNRNGSFSGDELMLLRNTPQLTTPVSATITIPATASPGNTRMRVMSSYQPIYGACNVGTTPILGNNGEVEDYKVFLSTTGCNTSACRTTVLEEDLNSGNDLSAASLIKLYPNPSTKEVKLLIDPSATESAKVEVYNTKGMLVYKNDKVASGTDLTFGEDLPAGMYSVKIMYNQEQKVLKLIKGN